MVVMGSADPVPWAVVLPASGEREGGHPLRSGCVGPPHPLELGEENRTQAGAAMSGRPAVAMR